MELMEVQKMEFARGEGLSGAQERKKEKREKEEKRLAKWTRMKETRGPSMARLRQRSTAAKRR
jgi:hypothetical protein